MEEGRVIPSKDDRWPVLDYAADSSAMEALHLPMQVVGKVKLELTKTAPEWQNVPLWVTSRGVTTGLMSAGGTELEIAFDLVDHRVVFTTTDGRADGFDLSPRPLREFTANVMSTLQRLGVRVTINPMTVEVPNPVRCDLHEGCDTYDPEVANRLFRVFARTAAVLEEFRAGFWGKQSPLGLYWGTFDLSVSRYNLVPLEPPDDAGVIGRIAMDSQLVEVGFWPGSAAYPRAAFFAFAFPKPQGIEAAAIEPGEAGWNADLGEFVLDYEDVRATGDPRAAILAFAQSAYAAGADLAGWDRALLDRTPDV
jgi:uncharacterized protein DUF5996